MTGVSGPFAELCTCSSRVNTAGGYGRVVGLKLWLRHPKWPVKSGAPQWGHKLGYPGSEG